MNLEALEQLIGGPRDNALLRYSLGGEYLKAGNAAKAVEYLQSAVERDLRFSAAWKLLGKALTEAGDPAAALAAYRRGIEVSTERGDVQAAREMTVFARRLEKALGTPEA